MQAQDAILAVQLERPRPKDLGKLSRRQPSQDVHLPEPVLRDDVALCSEEVIKRAGPNVGHAPRVAVHRDFVLEFGQNSRAVYLRQGAAKQPPACQGTQNCHQENENQEVAKRS